MSRELYRVLSKDGEYMKAVNGLFDDLQNNTHHLHWTAEFQAKMLLFMTQIKHYYQNKITTGLIHITRLYTALEELMMSSLSNLRYPMIDSLAEQKNEKVWKVCLIEMEIFVSSLEIYAIGMRTTFEKNPIINSRFNSYKCSATRVLEAPMTIIL
jgi:hypothetical protein